MNKMSTKQIDLEEMKASIAEEVRDGALRPCPRLL